MKNSRTLYLVVALSMVVGIWCDYKGSEWPLEYKTIITLVNGEKTSLNKVETPAVASLLKIGANLAYTLAISIFISVFISAFIEKKRQQEQEKHLEDRTQEQKKYLDDIRKAINVDVFEALFSRFVPDQIFKSIKDSIISSKFLRKNQRNIYEFKAVGDKVHALVTFRYEIENITQSNIEDNIGIVWSKDSEEDRLVYWKCVINEHEKVLYDAEKNFTDPDISLCKSDEGHTHINYKIQLPKGQKADLIQIWNYTSNPAHTQHLWCSKSPLINLEIQANVPEGFAVEIFPFSSVQIKPELKMPNRVIYTAKGGILPYQGYQLKLNKLKK